MDLRQTLDLRAPSKRQQEWEHMNRAEKKHALYLQQVELLNTFLAHHAISQAQYEKSFRDLTEKMGEVAISGIEN